MIFRSIRIKEGMAEREISFSSGVNLIHSKKNSCGKTTLLRFMLYSLGYNIPSTKKIRRSMAIRYRWRQRNQGKTGERTQVAADHAGSLCA